MLVRFIPMLDAYLLHHPLLAAQASTASSQEVHSSSTLQYKKFGLELSHTHTTNAVHKKMTTIRKVCNAAAAALKLLPFTNEGCGVDMVFGVKNPDALMMLIQLKMAREMVVLASVTIQSESEEPLMTDGNNITWEDRTEANQVPGVVYTTYDDLFDGCVDDNDFDYEATEIFHMYSKDWRQAFKGDAVVELPDVCSLDRANDEEGHLNHETDVIEDPKCAACVAAVKEALNAL